LKVDLSEGFLYLFNKLDRVFLSTGSIFSITSLLCALFVAVAFVVYRRRRKGRRLRVRAIARALFPSRILKSPSHSVDIGFFFFSVFIYGIVFGWAVVSYQMLSNGLIQGLVATFGAVTPTSLPEWGSRSVVTLALFLAFEFGYWLHHYLSHRVPLLWEFHKVHHTAEVLTPLTVFRVHPLDTVIYYNVLAVSMALASGVSNYLLGQTTYQYAITGSNILLVLFIHAYVHLQHTHLWISFRGVLGRLFLSPAHHQVHHSTNPAHFNKNLGNCLGIWDWLFGTLYIPSREPEKLQFGVDPGHSHDHVLTHAMIDPLVRAFGHVGELFRRPPYRAAPDTVVSDEALQRVAAPAEAKPAATSAAT
jgi:sterol desaturase/sphingolipid hydroxylase (fatty acid hydroxylase superfamily)